MDCGIAIQLFDSREQFGLCRIRGQLELHRMQPELAAHLVLRANVGARGGIVADQNDGESGRDSLRLERRDFAAQFGINFFRRDPAVDQLHRISTSCIIASCKRTRSCSKSSSVDGWRDPMRRAEDDAHRGKGFGEE